MDENCITKSSIFRRRAISHGDSSSFVSSFVPETVQSSRMYESSGSDAKPSSTYVSWWMPLPPLTPTTPHQNDALDNNNAIAFRFPSIAIATKCDEHREQSKSPDSVALPRTKAIETEQERRKHCQVEKTYSSPACLNFLPPIPKGPVCLVAPSVTNEQTTKQIQDSPSPRSHHERELLEKFVYGLGEVYEEDNLYESILSPTVAEIDFFLDKVASRRSRCEDSKTTSLFHDEHESDGDVEEIKSLGATNRFVAGMKMTSNDTQTHVKENYHTNGKRALRRSSSTLPECSANQRNGKYNILPQIEPFKDKPYPLHEASPAVPNVKIPKQTRRDA